MLRNLEKDLATALAEIERLKPMVIDWNGVRAIMDSDDVIWVHGDDYASAVKERDEARAQVAMAYEAVAIRSENYARGAPYNQRASINALANSLRGMTPAHAKAALEAYGREKMREGMKHMLNRLQHEGQINPSLTYADAIDWAEYVLDAMEKEVGE